MSEGFLENVRSSSSSGGLLQDLYNKDNFIAGSMNTASYVASISDTIELDGLIDPTGKDVIIIVFGYTSLMQTYASVAARYFVLPMQGNLKMTVGSTVTFSRVDYMDINTQYNYPTAVNRYNGSITYTVNQMYSQNQGTLKYYRTFLKLSNTQFAGASTALFAPQN